MAVFGLYFDDVRVGHIETVGRDGFLGALDVSCLAKTKLRKNSRKR